MAGFPHVREHGRGAQAGGAVMGSEIDLDPWDVAIGSGEDADHHDNWPGVYGLYKKGNDDAR